MHKGENNNEKVLILTNKTDITADFVVIELQKRGREYIRFNTEDFPGRTFGSICPTDDHNACSFENNKGKFNLNEISSIWYRRPGIPLPDDTITDQGIRAFCSKESNEFLETIWFFFKGLWVSYPPSIFHAQNKLYQLGIAKRLGFQVPRTLSTNDPRKAMEFIKTALSKVVVKAVRQGVLKVGDQENVIFTNEVTEKDIEALMDVKYCPVIFQEYIPKRFDLRVTVVGSRVFAVEIHPNSKVLNSEFDWRRGDQETLLYRIHTLPEDIESLCVNLLEALDLNFGAIDLVYSDTGDYFFLEINPNGQWAWLEQKLGISISGSLVDLLTGTG